MTSLYQLPLPLCAVTLLYQLCVFFTQALSCAAVDDVAAWCVLALASAFAQSESPLQGLYTTLGAIGYIVIMAFVVRPVLARVHRLVDKKGGTSSSYYETVIFLLLIVSAFTTEALGIHAFFGSFMMGLMVPKDNGFAEGLASRMELVVSKCAAHGTAWD